MSQPQCYQMQLYDYISALADVCPAVGEQKNNCRWIHHSPMKNVDEHSLTGVQHSRLLDMSLKEKSTKKLSVGIRLTSPLLIQSQNVACQQVVKI